MCSILRRIFYNLNLRRASVMRLFYCLITATGKRPRRCHPFSSHPCFYKNLYIETSTPFLRRLRVFSSHRVLNPDVRFYMYQRCKHGQAVMVECCEDLNLFICILFIRFLNRFCTFSSDFLVKPKNGGESPLFQRWLLSSNQTFPISN